MGAGRVDTEIDILAGVGKGGEQFHGLRGRTRCMTGGNASLDQLIKGTEKGILVTRLWYIRAVDPQTLLLTGKCRPSDLP